MRWQVLAGFLAIGLFAVAPASASYINAVTASNPLVYYQMQETSGTTASDTAGYQNATYSSLFSGDSGPTLNQPGPTLKGVSGTVSAQFDGLSGGTAVSGCDYVDATGLYSSSGPPARVGLGDNFSVEFWFNNTRSETGVGPISGDLYSRHGTGFVVGIDGTYTGYNPNCMFLQVADSILVPSTFNPAENTWYHIVATYNHTDSSHVEVCLYEDGNKIIDSTVATSQTLANNGASDFAMRSDGEWGFQGYMAEAALYNGALGQTDVTAHYNASQTPEPCSFVLLGFGLVGLLCYAWRKRK